MAIITLDIAKFRVLFAAFNNPTCYPDLVIQTFWDIATNYVSDINGGCYVQGMRFAQQTYALNLMTAHLLALNDLIAAGQTPGIEINATIDKISVGMQPPPLKDQWAYWLNTTPYGAQLLALLELASVGGMYFGGAGAPVVTAFRR